MHAEDGAQLVTSAGEPCQGWPHGADALPCREWEGARLWAGRTSPWCASWMLYSSRPLSGPNTRILPSDQPVSTCLPSCTGRTAGIRPAPLTAGHGCAVQDAARAACDPGAGRRVLGPVQMRSPRAGLGPAGSQSPPGRRRSSGRPCRAGGCAAAPSAWPASICAPRPAAHTSRVVNQCRQAPLRLLMTMPMPECQARQLAGPGGGVTGCCQAGRCPVLDPAPAIAALHPASAPCTISCQGSRSPADWALQAQRAGHQACWRAGRARLATGGKQLAAVLGEGDTGDWARVCGLQQLRGQLLGLPTRPTISTGHLASPDGAALALLSQMDSCSSCSALCAAFAAAMPGVPQAAHAPRHMAPGAKRAHAGPGPGRGLHLGIDKHLVHVAAQRAGHA